jgi:hypothetical protein
MLAFILGDFLNSGSSFFNRSRENVGVIAGHKVHYTEYEAAKDQLTEVYKIESGSNDINEELGIQIRNQVWQMLMMDYTLREQTEKIGMEVSPINMTMFIRNEYRYNGDKTKVQVIDKYGRTAWVTVEQAKAHEIPMYSNGPAKIDAGYRPAYVGEEDLVAFFKTFLGIPNVDVYNKNTGAWSTHENPEECEAGLEKIANYFKGDFSELRDIIALQPNNKVKALFGVRTTDDGKQYQAVYPKVLRANATDASVAKLDAEIQERKNNGALSTTEFTFGEFKEYTVEPTTFAPDTTTSDMPFAPDSPWG